ncbi:hypothetical protein LRS71_04070 [Rhodococcus pyridinivorans]|uniref:hypothetical protein n=1 Tax=Rhodococcus pyridinivorans TaxID=103816 RepID=UPI001E3800C6|nr:hypothetical protein [Rhodococcus pyridinivorans]MCD5418740.1 hypothetical protein [Rhodococcus pyridinivorans]
MKHFARGRTAATVGAAVLATLLGAIVAHLVEAAPVIAGECEATYATHDITRVEMTVAVDAAAVVLDGLEQGHIV